MKAPNQEKTKQKVSESEQRYRTLLNSIEQGFCVLEMVFDENYLPVDYYFLEVNPAFEAMTGIPYEEALSGKTARELVPNLEDKWVEIYGNVALMGETVRFIESSEAMNRWFDVYACRVGDEMSRQVALIFNDITERKQSEQALRESENKYRTLIEQASDGIHTYDLQGNFIETNSKLCEMLGYTREELLRLNVKDLVPAEDLAANPIHFEELLAGKTLLRERSLLRKDGTLIPVELSGKMVQDGVLQAIIRDITERKGAEEALRSNENQLRLITDSIPLLISYVDREHRYKFVNRNYTEWFGKTREEVIGKHLSEILGDAAYRSLLPEVEKVLSGEEVSFERSVPYKSGERFINVHYIPDFDAATGQVRGFNAFVQDISERKRAEEALRESEEWLRAIFDASRDGILVEDDERIIYVNKSYLHLLGYDDPAELTGQHISVVISSEDVERVTGFGKARLRGEQPPLKYEFKGKRKDETSVEVEASVSVSNAGRHIYITTIVRDITERKRVAMLLDAQKQALEMVVAGNPLAEVLEYLANIVEHQSAGSSIASLLLLDEQGRLYNGASPSLPEDYLQAIEGIKADENLGTCSRAAATGKMVMTPDIGADPKWQDIKHLPLNLGLQSAWSMPIIASDGRVLGTFGTYFREKREPTELEKQTVEILSRTAALAIERIRAEEELRKYQDELEKRVGERTQELDAANKDLQLENRQRRLVEKERVRLLEQLVTTQEEERRRIARDLHDHLGQQLIAMRLKLEILKRTSGKNEQLCKQIDDMLRVTKEIDSDVDFLAWKMRPSALDDIGLVAALDRYVHEWSRHFEISADFDASRFSQHRFAPETETNLYRIVQEALNNVAKHARAQSVDISLASRDDLTSLIIEDDGDGFSPEEQIPNGRAAKGMGLIGMRERASLVGGTLEIESAKGKGTTVYVRIPASMAKREGKNE